MYTKRHTFTTFSYWLVAAISILLASRFLTFKEGSLQALSSYVVYPWLVAQRTVVTPVKNWFEHRKTVAELHKLCTHYYTELETLVAENIMLHSSLAYMNVTQELTDFKKRYVTDTAVIAQVLLKHFSDQSHFFLIDAGSRRGITPDMVAVYKNCLIGRVSEVYPFYSKVILVTDKSCKVAAFCAHTGAPGIHEGLNAFGRTKLTFVSHLEKLQEHDTIISSGEGLVFPKGFGLGRIDSYALKGFQYDITVQPLVAMDTVTSCCIIQKGAECLPLIRDH
jgi:cell shape-determining protein MreC